TVGEQLVGDRGELPAHGRSASPAWRCACALDQSDLLERLEVLAHRGVSELEVGCHFRRGQRVRPLQAVEDPTLGVGELRIGDLVHAGSLTEIPKPPLAYVGLAHSPLRLFAT